MKIFWAWQSDTPGNIGRFFVRDALNAAISQLKSDAEVVEPTERETRDAMELDHDRKGVPGSPDLARTIMEKIEAAAVFVADVTPVGTVLIAVQVEEKKQPKRLINSNVAIELGYSLRTRTDRSLLMVMNSHYGTRADLPFDVAHKGGPIMFELAPDADKKAVAAASAKLKAEFVEAIKLCLVDEVNARKNSVLPEMRSFPAHASEGTPGRFKAMGVPIGVTTNTLFNAGISEIRLVDSPVLWLRVMPTAQQDQEWPVTKLRKLATEGGLSLLPVVQSGSGLGYFRSHEGFGIYEVMTDDPGNTPGVVMAFTNGEIWSVDTWLLEVSKRGGMNFVPPIEKELRAALKSYADFLVKMGINPPFRWVVGMENLLGRSIAFRQTPPFNRSGPCLKDVLVEQGLFTPGESPARSLSPFFAKLYDACGADRPAEMDED